MATERQIFQQLDQEVETSRKRLEGAANCMVLEQARIQARHPLLRRVLGVLEWIGPSQGMFVRAQFKTAIRNFETATSEASFWKRHYGRE